MKKYTAMLLASLVLASCGNSPKNPDAVEGQEGTQLAKGITPADQIIKDMGGLRGLFESLDNENPTLIKQKLQKYGVDYIDWKNEGDLKAQAADGCPVPTFEFAERSTMQRMPDNTVVWIDSSGRPYRAAKTITPVVATPRTTRVNDCSAAVGRLGGSGYQGGHLVGLQIGGWGLRSNLVPQNSNFNGGNWREIENAASLCQNLHNNFFDYLGRRGSAYYSASVRYASSGTYTPYEFEVMIETYRPTFNTSDSEVILGTFTNTTYGGPNGTATRQRVVQELRDEGCL